MKNRIPRKTKKWHKKHRYQTHYDSQGKAYFTRTIAGIWNGRFYYIHGTPLTINSFYGK